MGLRQQQNLLARLYTDAELRERFRDERCAVALEFGLSAAEGEDLAAIAEAEIDWFADSLFWKRLREIGKLLPATSRALGAELEVHFRNFSVGFNPQSVKKHLEDALEFSSWLLRANGISSEAADVVRFESTRLRHNVRQRRFSVCRSSYDIRPLLAGVSSDDALALKAKTGIAIWVTLRKRTRFFYI